MIEVYRCDIRYEEWATEVIVEASLTDEGRKAGAPPPIFRPYANSLIAVCVRDDWTPDEFARVVEVAREKVAKWCDDQNRAMAVVRYFVESLKVTPA